MAFRHGRFAEIKVDGDALSTFCDSADLSLDIDTADTTTFGSAWKTNVVGSGGGKIDLGGKYDPTASTGPGALIFAAITANQGGTPSVITLYPGGNVAGQTLWTVDANFTSYAESAPVGGAVTFKASLIVTGAPVPTTV